MRLSPRDTVHAFTYKGTGESTWRSAPSTVGAGALIEPRGFVFVPPARSYDPDPSNVGGAGRYAPAPSTMAPEFDLPVNARYNGSHLALLYHFLGADAYTGLVTGDGGNHVAELQSHLDSIINYAVAYGSTAYYELDSAKVGRFVWTHENGRRSDWSFRIVGRRWLDDSDDDAANGATQFGAVDYLGDPHDVLAEHVTLYLDLGSAGTISTVVPAASFTLDLDRALQGEPDHLNPLVRREVFAPDPGYQGTLTIQAPRWASSVYSLYHANGTHLKAQIVADSGIAVPNSSPEVNHKITFDLPLCVVEDYQQSESGTVGEQLTLGVYRPRTTPAGMSAVVPRVDALNSNEATYAA